MKRINWLFEIRLRTTVGPDFQVKCVDHNLVFFKNSKIKGNNYVLDFELLTEQEILGVGAILKEVYDDFSEDPYRGGQDDNRTKSLNRNSEASRQLLGTVINIQASALHKLLLLTSGDHLLSESNLDLVLTLIQNKKEPRFHPEDVTNSRIYSSLKKLYILPGIAPRTHPLTGAALGLDSRPSLENASRLMAFLSNNSEDLTLKDHLKRDFIEASSTKKSLKDLSRINTIYRIFFSDYQELAESMTARELGAISQILVNDAHNGQFSERILKNRSKAMDPAVRPLSTYGVDSVLRYLSKDEQKSLSSLTVIEHLNQLITGRDMSAQTQPIVYAALAEVLAVKGEKKALEVAGMLKHLQLSKYRNLKMYEATVGIIEEVLKPENDDLPFGWAAQLSEHAWVLSSHIPKEKELALNV